MFNQFEILKIAFDFQNRDFRKAIAAIERASARATIDPADGFWAFSPTQWRAKDRKKHAAMVAAFAGSSHRVGVDLPWMLTCDNPKKTVVIVGQDPLRKLKDFSATEKWQGRVIIGTPYAVHSTFYRERTEVYWLIFDGLLKTECNVYLTDAVKLYTGTHLSVDDFDRETIRQEMESVRPDLIVCFGNDSLSALGLTNKRGGPLSLTSINANTRSGGIPVLCTLHPSGAANRYWNAQLGGRSASNANKAKFILDCIKAGLTA